LFNFFLIQAKGGHLSVPLPLNMPLECGICWSQGTVAALWLVLISHPSESWGCIFKSS